MSTARLGNVGGIVLRGAADDATTLAPRLERARSVLVDACEVAADDPDPIAALLAASDEERLLILAGGDAPLPSLEELVVFCAWPEAPALVWESGGRPGAALLTRDAASAEALGQRARHSAPSDILVDWAQALEAERLDGDRLLGPSVADAAGGEA